MEQISGILQIVMFLSLIAVCIFVIMFLNQAKQTAQSISNSLTETLELARRIENNTKPAIQQLYTTLQDTSTTLHSLQNQIGTIEATLNQFKQIAVRVNDLETKLQSKIEKPVMQAAGIIAGISSAIETFTSEFKKK